MFPIEANRSESVSESTLERTKTILSPLLPFHTDKDLLYFSVESIPIDLNGLLYVVKTSFLSLRFKIASVYIILFSVSFLSCSHLIARWNTMEIAWSYRLLTWSIGSCCRITSLFRSIILFRPRNRNAMENKEERLSCIEGIIRSAVIWLREEQAVILKSDFTTSGGYTIKFLWSFRYSVQ